MSTESKYEPDEPVLLYRYGSITLKKAVQIVMGCEPNERSGATIFRDHEPTLLDLAHITELSMRPEFKT